MTRNKSAYLLCTIKITTLITCVLTLRSNHGGTAARHGMYQMLDGVSWDSYPCFLQQLPQSIQVTWLLILYLSEEDFPQMFDGIQVWALSRPVQDLYTRALKESTHPPRFMARGIVLLEDKCLPLTIKRCCRGKHVISEHSDVLVLSHRPLSRKRHCCARNR